MKLDPASFERDAMRYLLEDISEEERAAFETRLLQQDGLADELAALEDELIDRYVQGELSPDERALVEQRVLPRPGRAEKLALSRGLVRVAASQPGARRSGEQASRGDSRSGRVARPPARQWARPRLFAVAAAACVLVALWLWSTRSFPPRAAPPDSIARTPINPSAPRSPDIPPPPAPPSEHAPAEPAQKPVMLAMLLLSTRAQAAPQLVLPADAQEVVLQIDLEGEDRYAAFDASLVSESGARVWSAVRARADRKAGLLELHLAAAPLATGNYRLVLRGSSAKEQLASLPLQITRAR